MPDTGAFSCGKKAFKLMRKPVAPRILGLLALYCAVFIALVMIQFTQKGNFSRQIGGMIINGQYRPSADDETSSDANEFLLAGGALVSFGGLEFNLKNRNDRFDKNGFVLIDSKGERQPAIPEYLIQSGDTVRFRLPEGTEIAFTSLYSGGGPELRITAVFNDDDGLPNGVSTLEIPFKPQRSSVVRNTENGQLSVLYNNLYYQFVHFALGAGQERLLLNREHPSVLYRARPQQGFNPADFVIAQAQSEQSFNDALAQWLDQSFSQWRAAANVPADEDMIIAYSGESLRRGNYQATVASLSPALPSGRRTHESSVYLGGMPQALRSFTAAEREKLNRVTRLINTKSTDLLKESHVFTFLSIRGLTAQINNGLAYIRSIDPQSLTLDVTPGIFEGYVDITQLSLKADNPFEPLIERACELIAEGIQKSGEREMVLVYLNDSAEIEFNLRLGKALWLWAAAKGGEAGDSNGWAALGRSLALSVLSLTESSGVTQATAPRVLVRSETGERGEKPDSRISTARLYRILNPGDFYPRAAGIGSGTNVIWAWTIVPAVSAVQDEESLDISVSFPVNETHYMIIRGIRSFGRIQLYDIDFRSDPQFERYDSSGWVYYPEEQILVLKMKHRVTTEHIRIFFRKEPEPEPAAEDEAAEAAAGTGNELVNEANAGGGILAP
jgi:hypothetical protein